MSPKSSRPRGWRRLNLGPKQRRSWSPKQRTAAQLARSLKRFQTQASNGQSKLLADVFVWGAKRHHDLRSFRQHFEELVIAFLLERSDLGSLEPFCRVAPSMSSCMISFSFILCPFFCCSFRMRSQQPGCDDHRAVSEACTSYVSMRGARYGRGGAFSCSAFRRPDQKDTGELQIGSWQACPTSGTAAWLYGWLF